MESQASALIPTRWPLAIGKSFASALLFSTVLTFPNSGALADEGGVSFWIPGFFGSLAASPLQPGWSVANIFYHTSVDAGGDVAFARQVARGNITANMINCRRHLAVHVRMGSLRRACLRAASPPRIRVLISGVRVRSTQPGGAAAAGGSATRAEKPSATTAPAMIARPWRRGRPDALSTRMW